jgi:hypothetical protein
VESWKLASKHARGRVALATAAQAHDSKWERRQVFVVVLCVFRHNRIIGGPYICIYTYRKK